jgi:hypothetical protein
MKEVQSGKAEERKEFPPTLSLEVGEHVVAVALGEELGVKTRYGSRDLLRVVTRIEPEKTYTMWWPGKLNRPGIGNPFMLSRPEKSNYILSVPETDEERKILWNTGECPKGAADIDASAKARQEILSRWKS